MKRTAAQALIAAELIENPKLPWPLPHVMNKLATTDEAAAAWKLLGEDQPTINRVISCVRTALQSAVNETARPTHKDETADIKRIIKLAGDLQKAIKASSLPGDWCRLNALELHAEEMPTQSVSVGWHSLRSGGHGHGYTLSIADVLEVTSVLARDHLDGLPLRAVTRRREQPEVSSFVRHLAWQFAREFGKEMRLAIAYIGTAIFDLSENPLDAAAVDAILKDRPAAFGPPDLAG